MTFEVIFYIAYIIPIKVLGCVIIIYITCKKGHMFPKIDYTDKMVTKKKLLW